MDKGFFIKLTFAVVKVLDASPDDKELKRQIQESAEGILVDILLIAENASLSLEQKRTTAARTLERIDALLQRFSEARKKGMTDQANIVVLEREYAKVKAWVEGFAAALPQKQEEQANIPRLPARTREESITNIQPVSKLPAPRKLSDRQRRILEILQNKEKVQVWELQKVFPQVTKRTLRRDLDDLLQQNLVERKGEWNSVSYQAR